MNKTLLCAVVSIAALIAGVLVASCGGPTYEADVSEAAARSDSGNAEPDASTSPAQPDLQERAVEDEIASEGVAPESDVAVEPTTEPEAAAEAPTEDVSLGAFVEALNELHRIADWVQRRDVPLVGAEPDPSSETPSPGAAAEPTSLLDSATDGLPDEQD